MTVQWMMASMLLGLMLYGAGTVAEAVVSLRVGRPRRVIWLVAMLYTTTLTMCWLIPAESITDRRSTPSASISTVSDGTSIVESNVSTSTALLASALAGAIPTGNAAVNRLVPFLSFGATLALGAVLLLGMLRYRRARRAWLPMQLHGHRVLVSEDTGPALIGLRHTDIVLPQWVLELDDDAQRAILTHEAQHRYANDHWLRAVAALLLVALAWHPVMWLLSRRLIRAIEFDCDARVVSDGIAATTYAVVLLDAFQRRTRWSAWVPSPALAERASGLGQRVENLFRPRPRSVKMKTVSGIALVAAITSLTAMVPAPQPTQLTTVSRKADAASVAKMKSALIRLVRAEEAHYADRGTYTTDMAALRAVNKEPIGGDSVWVSVIFAGGHGWTGSARFRGNNNVRCVVYVGDPEELPKLPKTFSQQSPTAEGAVMCDTP